MSSNLWEVVAAYPLQESKQWWWCVFSIHLCMRAGSAELLNLNREWGNKSNNAGDVLLALLYDESTKSTRNLGPERSSAHNKDRRYDNVSECNLVISSRTLWVFHGTVEHFSKTAPQHTGEHLWQQDVLVIIFRYKAQLFKEQKCSYQHNQKTLGLNDNVWNVKAGYHSELWGSFWEKKKSLCQDLSKRARMRQERTTAGKKTKAGSVTCPVIAPHTSSPSPLWTGGWLVWISSSGCRCRF